MTEKDGSRPQAQRRENHASARARDEAEAELPLHQLDGEEISSRCSDLAGLLN